MKLILRVYNGEFILESKNNALLPAEFDRDATFGIDYDVQNNDIYTLSWESKEGVTSQVTYSDRTFGVAVDDGTSEFHEKTLLGSTGKVSS